jgi:PadR family transcriptional regulator, regulatory protein AphA
VSLRAAILGFLEMEPTSGYTLRQRFDGSVASFWSVTQSQIYRELHQLEEDGLVAVRVEPGDGKPDRKVYALTDTGRASLEQWLAAPTEPMQLRHPLLLKFVLSSQVDPAVLDAMLAKYVEAVQTIRAEYQQRLGMTEIFDLARSEREAVIWKLSIEHGLGWCDLEMGWAQRARAELSKTPTTKNTKGRKRK